LSTWIGRLLWIDGLAALTAGVVTLAFDGFLSNLYSLPQQLITFIGAVNLAYSSFSLTLAMRRRRSLNLIVALALANALWSFVCVGLAISFRDQAKALGLGVLLFECLFVATLAWLEWRHRHALVYGRCTEPFL